MIGRREDHQCKDSLADQTLDESSFKVTGQNTQAEAKKTQVYLVGRQRQEHWRDNHLYDQSS